MAATSVAAISPSRNGMSDDRPSMTCTSTPRALNVHAYSLPITPAPTMARRFGSAWMSSSSVESCTRSFSKGNTGGRNGDDPVAMSTLAARSRMSSAPGAVTRIV
jgi:hypothetical protein